ncbi:MAG: hypothetical protein OXD40_04635 [bacterium]|nr:hypothetical protein [bacterium]
MTIVQAANENQPERVTRTDLEMRLGAVGGRGALLTQDESGMDLALKADAFYVETESEAVSNEGSTTGVASRARLALEGSRSFDMGDGGVVTPGLELGLRHDGVDAETGTGVELGGRIAYENAATGLSVEARVLAPDGECEAGKSLQGELGYGLSMFGDRFTGTPYVGFGLSDGDGLDFRLGWWLTSTLEGDPGFEVNLDATRLEPANNAAPEYGVMLRAAIRCDCGRVPACAATC